LAQSFRNIALLAFAFCLVKAAEAQAPVLSADDTAAYINTTLHKYPTLEFVDSGCPGYEQVVTISGDRRSLIIKQTLGKVVDGRCDSVQTLTVPIFSLDRRSIGSWRKQGQHTALLLECTNFVDCFSRRSDAQVLASAENRWFLQVTAPAAISVRLTEAMQHLVESLSNEARARAEGPDPFAKPGH